MLYLVKEDLLLRVEYLNKKIRAAMPLIKSGKLKSGMTEYTEVINALKDARGIIKRIEALAEVADKKKGDKK